MTVARWRHGAGGQRMIVCASHGHRGKPNKLWKDWGATPRDIDTSEAFHLYGFLAALDVALAERGHDLVVLSDGTFQDRWDRAHAYGADLYLACHFNAGPGTQGIWLPDWRSKTGRPLAERIANEVQSVTEGIRQDVIDATPDDWTKNAYATIRGVRPTAICCEPLRVDRDEHLPYFTPWGFNQITTAMARAIDEWSQA